MGRFLTKGECEKVLTRVGQIHTITVKCPLVDEGIRKLKEGCEMMVSEYKESDNIYRSVPAVDLLGVFMISQVMGGDTNKVDIVSIIVSSLKAFPKLKYITLEFTDDLKVEGVYESLISKGKKTGDFYSVDVLEMNLSDMFSQDVIDIFNKVLMMNGIVPNSYLERVFRIEFTYDEYISFMDMFLGNNGQMFHQHNEHICDYFRTFPSMVNKQKPLIRVITNYSDDCLNCS